MKIKSSLIMLALAVACLRVDLVSAQTEATDTSTATQVTSLAESESVSDIFDTGGLLEADFQKDPTYIKSTSLTLKNTERVFVYSGQVEVKHGGMIMTCSLLEGNYDENNQIQTLTAKENVVITKGDTIRATSGRAFYEASKETLTLTESPELLQKGNVLTADAITIFLEEDRSTASGQVRVKVIKTGTTETKL